MELIVKMPFYNIIFYSNSQSIKIVKPTKKESYKSILPQEVEQQIFKQETEKEILLYNQQMNHFSL